MKQLLVVGIGPGNKGAMTLAAHAAMNRADVIVGYTAYIELVRPLFPEKPMVATSMRHEVDRCREALRLANEERCVALICSGDAGRLRHGPGSRWSSRRNTPMLQSKSYPASPRRSPARLCWARR